MRTTSVKAAFRLRKDYPASKSKRESEKLKIEKKVLVGAKNGMPLKKIKKLTDRYELLGYATSFFDNIGVAVTKKRGQKIPHDIFALRLGKYAILGLPGEPFGAYSRMLRARSIGRRLITAELCNGYLSYLPMKKDYPLGSYEVNAAVCDSSSEKALFSSGLNALKKLGL